MSRTLRIVVPTYWYPSHAADTNATYVHDINRHLARRGHAVRVVTPRSAGGAPREAFDGVEVVRFPLEVPDDLSYGHVAQTKVGLAGSLQRLVVMGRYMAAQRQAAIDEARAFQADILHAHWAIPTGPAAVSAAQVLGIPSVITLHGGDVYVNKEQGYDFPTRPYVRPVLKWTLNAATALTAITEDCRQHALRAGGVDEPAVAVTAFGVPDPGEVGWDTRNLVAGHGRDRGPAQHARAVVRAAVQEHLGEDREVGPNQPRIATSEPCSATASSNMTRHSDSATRPSSVSIHTLRRGRIDAVTFTSSSTVRSFVELVGRPAATSGRFVAATIGPITADTARELGIREIIEAEPHTVPGLVESLARRFG